MAARKPRKTASAARIRVHTDEYGRKVYSIVGTKKFAYTLAKAKEIASKTKKRKSSKSSTAMTVSSRKPAKRPAKRTTAKRGGAKRNAKGQFVKRGAKKTTRRNAGRTKSKSLALALAARRLRQAKSKSGLSGITLAQTKAVARNILREAGEDPSSAYGVKALAKDVKRAGVITGLTAESAYMAGGVDESMLPAAIRSKGYFDFDSPHRLSWTKL
jgi:hypothetical protein